VKYSGPFIIFLWTSSHVRIEANEKADVLVKHTFTCRFITKLVNKISFSDIILHFQKVLKNTNPTTRLYNLIRLKIPEFLWFLNSNLLKFYISVFSMYSFGHNRLHAHAYKFNLICSPFCPRRAEISICVTIMYFFTCPV